MNVLRRTPNRRLVTAIAVAGVLAAGGTAAARAAFGGGAAPPPPKPLDRAVLDALRAPAPAGLSARIAFTNHLFPTGALPSGLASPLLSGATGRLWVRSDGRFRLELQSDGAGDSQIVSDGKTVTVYDASTNTLYRLALPASATSRHERQGAKAHHAPTLADVDRFLRRLGATVNVAPATPTTEAGRPAYATRLSPAHDGGLLGGVGLAWDALRGVPLRLTVTAQGDSSPVLELRVTDISFGAVPASDVAVPSPPGAKVVNLDLAGSRGGHAGGEPAKQPAVTGLDAVRAALPFPLSAPDTLDGLARRSVRLVHIHGEPAAVVVYGQGLGAIVVLERAAQGTSGRQGQGPDPLSQLPTVSIAGATGHELATALGTAIAFQRAGVSYLVGGSVPTVAIEHAARELVG